MTDAVVIAVVIADDVDDWLSWVPLMACWRVHDVVQYRCRSLRLLIVFIVTAVGVSILAR